MHTKAALVAMQVTQQRLYMKMIVIKTRGEVSDFYCHMHQITKAHNHVLFLVAPTLPSCH